MPPLKTRGKVLITGANGYLASWTVQKYLEQGYSVRGTVRSASKANLLRERFKSFGDRFEVVIIEDMCKVGAFDDVLNEIVAVNHMATPIDVETDDPDIYIKPALDGSLNLLTSIVRYGTDVQRVIYTSSLGAIASSGSGDEFGPPRTYTENDWNEVAVEIMNRDGRKTPRHIMYLASKVLAERAVWSFWDLNKQKVKWDFCVVCAPWLLGPTLHPFTHAKDLNVSLRVMYEICVDEGVDSMDENRLSQTIVWMDVRDLAESFVNLLRVEGIDGQRYLIAKETSSWQDWIDVLNRVADAEPNNHYTITLRKGQLGIERKIWGIYNTTKGNKMLAPTFHAMEETGRDMLMQWSSQLL